MSAQEIRFTVAESVFTYTKIDTSLRLLCSSTGSNTDAVAVLPMCRYGDFHDGIATVLDRILCGYGYINSRGLFITPIQYIAAEDFSEERAFVTDDVSTKLIDTTGTVLKDFKTILFTGKFNEGLALVSKIMNDTKGEYKRDGYVDRQGRFIIEPGEPDAITHPGIICEDDACSDGLLRVHTAGAQGRRYGFMDVHQKLRIPYMYEEASRFSVGIAAAARHGRYGFIDDHNRTVIDFRYDAAKCFSGDLAPVRLGGAWGYIDRGGKHAIAPQFDEAGEFRNGSARVKVQGKYGIINPEGEYLANPIFDGISNFHHGVCRIVLGGRSGVMNTEGETLLEG